MIGSDDPMVGFEHTFPTILTASYTVTLNPNGEMVNPATKTVIYGQAYGTMPTPVHSGYHFGGWWTTQANRW